MSSVSRGFRTSVFFLSSSILQKIAAAVCLVVVVVWSRRRQSPYYSLSLACGAVRVKDDFLSFFSHVLVHRIGAYESIRASLDSWQHPKMFLYLLGSKPKKSPKKSLKLY